jgi:hypothetical protein
LPKLLDYAPQPLLNDIVTGICLPVIGAGLSANATIPETKKMPLWDELGRHFAAILPDYPYTTPIDAISAYCQEYSRPTMIEELVKALFIEKSTPGASHLAFCKIPFDIVCTTNVDFLIERAYGTAKTNSSYCRPIIDEDQLSVAPTNQGVRLIKLHGDLHHPNRLIMTEEDYDTFISKYPLLCTYLANLLITRTPLFIGYSLEDPDFRQIFQVIGNRLHRMRRSAYVLTVGCKGPDTARFLRRGVKVISLPGSKADYDKILSTFFEEISNYWPSALRQSGTITDESVGELTVPEGSANRLCFFSIPVSLISFYRYFVFPIAEKFGFVPMTAESMIVPSENIVAKITALIDKAQLVIADLTSSWVQMEVDIAQRREMLSGLLLILPENEKIDLLKIGGKNSTIIRRPKDLLGTTHNLTDDLADSMFLHNIEEWFYGQAKKLEISLSEEPTRLIEKREYRAAVVAVMTLLETTLNDQFTDIGRKSMPMHLMIQSLTKRELINSSDAQKLIDVWMLRTKLVHGKRSVSAQESRTAVNFVLKIINELKHKNH